MEEPSYLIIPSAGLGKRMKSINAEMPKEMLPVGNKPAIQYAVEEGLSAGIKNIVIIINRQKEIIRRYFEDKKYMHTLYPLAQEIGECSFTFLHQKQPIGESDAISLAEDVVENHVSAIIYPDNIYFPAPGALKILKSIFQKHRMDVLALMEVTDENITGLGNSGRVDLLPLENGLFHVNRFYPKGEGHFVPRFKGELRTCGITISGPHIFEYIRRAREFVRDEEFTDAPVRSLQCKDKGLLGYRLPGRIFDIGNPIGYERCLSYIKNFIPNP